MFILCLDKTKRWREYKTPKHGRRKLYKKSSGSASPCKDDNVSDCTGASESTPVVYCGSRIEENVVSFAGSAACENKGSESGASPITPLVACGAIPSSILVSPSPPCSSSKQLYFLTVRNTEKCSIEQDMEDSIEAEKVEDNNEPPQLPFARHPNTAKKRLAFQFLTPPIASFSSKEKRCRISPNVAWSLEKLSQMMRTKEVCSPQCRFGCLQSDVLQPHSVHSHWTNTVQKRKKSTHLDIIFQQLQQSWCGSGGVQNFSYQIKGVQVCLSAVRLYQCLSVSSFWRLRTAVIRGVERRRHHPSVNAADNSVSLHTETHSVIVSWFREQLQNGVADKMPVSSKKNSGYKWILPYYTKGDTFKQFLADNMVARSKGLKTKYTCATFYRQWRHHFSDVLPAKGAGKSLFAACDTCSTFKASLCNTVSEVELKIVQAGRMKHLLRQKLERMFYAVRKSRSRQPGAESLSIIIDAIDHKKAQLIKKKGARQSKSTDSAVLSQAMQTVLVHGRGVWNFVSQPHVNGGGGVNYTIECLQRVLDALQAEDPGTPLPRTLYLQLDNCSGANKNKYMLAYASTLVDLGVFDEVTLSFLMVGHTHEDIDQIFSLVSAAVKHYDIVTPQDYEDVVVRALEQAGHTNVHFEILGYQHDYKEWLLPHIDPFLKWYAKPHVFCFVRDQDQVVRMRYKHWHRCFTWYPLANMTGELIHLPSVSDKGTEKVDGEDNAACTTLSQEYGSVRVSATQLASIPSSSASSSPHKEKACSTMAPLQRAVSVNLQNEVQAAVAGGLASTYASFNHCYGGSFYLSGVNSAAEQQSFRRSPGLAVTISAVSLHAVPNRAPFILNATCPYGSGKPNNMCSRFEKWEKSVPPSQQQSLFDFQILRQRTGALGLNIFERLLRGKLLLTHALRGHGGGHYRM